MPHGQPEPGTSQAQTVLPTTDSGDLVRCNAGGAADEHPQQQRGGDEQGHHHQLRGCHAGQSRQAERAQERKHQRQPQRYARGDDPASVRRHTSDSTTVFMSSVHMSSSPVKPPDSGSHRQTWARYPRSAMALLYVGTSGWGYSDWKGKFYPAKISSDQMLPFYARHFGAVELNTSSYRLPAPESMIKWRDSVPEGFRFALKVPRWITNRRQLQAEQPLDHFFELASLMGERCGPILVQLATKANVDQLAGLLELLRRYGRQMAFEFRHPSWLIEPAFELFEGQTARQDGGRRVRRRPGRDRRGRSAWLSRGLDQRAHRHQPAGYSAGT